LASLAKKNFESLGLGAPGLLGYPLSDTVGLNDTVDRLEVSLSNAAIPGPEP